MTTSLVSAIGSVNSRDKGRLAALTGGLLLSFDSVFIRFSGTGGIDTAFLFGVFSAISMFVVIHITDPRGIRGALLEGGWPLVVSGLLIVGSASTFVLSIKHTSVANTVFIMSARPVVTALISWLLLREKTSRSLWWAIAGVMLGIFVVVNGSLVGGNPLGDGLAIVTVLCLGLNGTLWRKYKDISRFAVIGLGGLLIALVMFIPASPAAYSLNTWLIMGCMGVLSAPLGRVLNALSSRYIPAAEMATITLISAVLAPVWAYLFFAERPPLSTMIGGAVIFLSIAAYLVRSGRGNSRAGYRRRREGEL